MKAQLGDLAIGIDGKQRLTLVLDDDVREVYDELHGDVVEVSLKKWHPHRSLTANAYAWVLIDTLADKLQLTKTEVYRDCIREIGGVSTTLCCTDAAVETFGKMWSKNGLGWFIETEPSRIEGCTTITAFYGSSTYDTRQMSALIDTIVQACQGQGIETMPPDKLQGLISDWDKHH